MRKKSEKSVYKSDICVFISNTDLDEKIKRISNKSRIKSRTR